MLTSQYIAYSAPNMVFAFLVSPMWILQGIYAKHFGVTLTTIATVLLISRLFDALTDPLIGYWSDRYHSKSGSRKPFVIAGGFLFVVSCYFLYVPVDPHHLPAETVVSTAYFLGWYLMFYLAWTLFEIPHLAWGSELARSGREKNKIYSLRALAGYLGLVLFYLVPLLPFFVGNAFTPQTLQWTAIAAGLLMLPTLYYCMKLTPDIAVQRAKQTNLWALRKEILSNKPFLLFITAFALYAMGAAGMWNALMFILFDTYFGFGEQFALLGLIGTVSGLLTLGFWCWLANRLDKKNTWALGQLLFVAAVLITSLLQPGTTGMAALAVVVILIYVAVSAVSALSPSVLADIIDYSTWKFGTDRAATYFAVYALVSKTSMAIGGSISLGLAGWYGFDPTTAVQTEDAVFGLHLAACWLPALLMLLSSLIITLLPITARRHGIIRRCLDARLARQFTLGKSHITDSATSALKAVSS